MQLLAIIAFRDGNLDLDTFKVVLSVGPTFTIMNFIKSKCYFIVYWLLFLVHLQRSLQLMIHFGCLFSLFFLQVP